MVYESKIIMPYTLNLHSTVWQLYLNKTRKKYITGIKDVYNTYLNYMQYNLILSILFILKNLNHKIYIDFMTHQWIYQTPNLKALHELVFSLSDHIMAASVQKTSVWVLCWFFFSVLFQSIIVGMLGRIVLYYRRRQWHPTPVLLPGKSHGRRSLVGCSPWGREESARAERLHFHFSHSCIGEGNGNPLQCSCLENPRDRGAW